MSNKFQPIENSKQGSDQFGRNNLFSVMKESVDVGHNITRMENSEGIENNACKLLRNLCVKLFQILTRPPKADL